MPQDLAGWLFYYSTNCQRKIFFGSKYRGYAALCKTSDVKQQRLHTLLLSNKNNANIAVRESVFDMLVWYTYPMNARANNDLSLPPAAFTVLKGPYSDGRDTLGHVQLTSDGPYTAFIPQPLQLVFPQVQRSFSFKGW